MTHDGLTHGISAPDHCQETAAGTEKQAKNGPAQALPAASKDGRSLPQAPPAAVEDLMNHTQRDSSP